MPEKIENRIGVSAPAHILWEILADIPRWPEWAPMYPKAAGKLGFGEKLSLTLALPGEEPRAINPAIVDWTPDEAIHWRMRHYRGWAWSIRYLEIDVMSDTGCVFSNGELFGGFFGDRALRKMRRPLRAAFTALGEALKERAEALWRERSGEAT